MKFETTAEQETKINAWLEELEPKILEKQSEHAREMGRMFGSPYYGAIGGGLTYEFTPTGIGVIVKVRESVTGEELDLTNYEEW
jgi:hypothetical protein